jgi:hypothetical protein
VAGRRHDSAVTFAAAEVVIEESSADNHVLAAVLHPERTSVDCLRSTASCGAAMSVALLDWMKEPQYATRYCRGALLLSSLSSGPRCGGTLAMQQQHQQNDGDEKSAHQLSSSASAPALVRQVLLLVLGRFYLRRCREYSAALELLDNYDSNLTWN